MSPAQPGEYVTEDGVHVRPVPGGDPIRTYMWVPARELLHADPLPFDPWPAARLLGVAITDTDQRYLIVQIGSVRLYTGPTDAAVRRHGAIIAAALEENARRRRSAHTTEAATLGRAVAAWLQACWSECAEALADLLLGDAPLP